MRTIGIAALLLSLGALVPGVLAGGALAEVGASVAGAREIPVGGRARNSYYRGRLLLLQGEIEEIHSSRLLSLEDVENDTVDEVFDEDEILVIVGSTVNMTAEADLSVSGRVYPFDIYALERRFGVRLDEEVREDLVEEYSGKAMFVANAAFDPPR